MNVDLPHEAWVEIEHRLKVRSGNCCEIRGPECLADPRTGSMGKLPRSRVSIHHRSPRGMGGTSRPDINDLGNLMWCCGDGVAGCHGWVTCGEVTEASRRGLVLRPGHPDPGDHPVILGSGRIVLLDPYGFYTELGWDRTTSI